MKVLVAGITEGAVGLADLHARATKLHASTHGPFDLLFAPLCLKGDELKLYRKGDLSFPLPLYFILASECSVDAAADLPVSSGSLGGNLFFIGAGCAIHLIHGLTVAIVSGGYKQSTFTLDPTESTVSADFRQLQVSSLIKAANAPGFRGVDVFLSSLWPGGVADTLPACPAAVMAASRGLAGEIAVTAIAKAIKPRYHFASGDVFWTRPPYRNGVTGHITRFISLGRVNAAAEDKSTKWIHALNLVPMTEMDRALLLEQPEGTTNSPYAEPLIRSEAVKRPGLASTSAASEGPLKRARLDAPSVPLPGFTHEKAAALAAAHVHGSGLAGHDQFRFDPRAINRGGGRGVPGLARGPPARPGERHVPAVARPPPRLNCWFCLATPEVEKHLITCIGEESYLAIPKGSLFPDRPGHILIVPIDHVSTVTDLSDAALLEIDRFEVAISEMFAVSEEVPVVCQRFAKTKGANHTHIEVFAVPKSTAGELRGLLEHCGGKVMPVPMKFEEVPTGKALRDIVAAGGEYIHIKLPSGVRLLYRKPAEARMPFSFGRNVLAEFLKMPRRADWKFCAVSLAEETKQAALFKASFRDHTPSGANCVP